MNDKSLIFNSQFYQQFRIPDKYIIFWIRMEEVVFQETSLEYDDQAEGPKKPKNPSNGNPNQPGHDQHDPEFRKKHQQYIAERKARKDEMIRQKQLQFGQSSSDEDQFPLPSTSQPQKIVSKPVQKSSLKKEVKIVQETKPQISDIEKFKVSIRVKKNSQWIQDSILFNKATLVLPNYSYYYKEISKLKIFSEAGLKDHLKIKVSYQSSQDFFLGASPKVLVKSLPMHYYVYAKILCEKLFTMGIDAKEPYIAQIPGIPQGITNNCSIYGRILKKSQLLGKWQERFIVINKEGIYSYKKFNQKHSMFIANGQISEIWTRFQVIENMLVVKMEYSSTKTEFGIPITNFLSPDSKHNWLWEFYKKSVKI